MTSTNFPTAEAALTYRQAADARMRALYRMAMPTLRGIEIKHLSATGFVRLSGGPVSKEELIRSILDIEYPRALLNEAGHVCYHKPGENWSACEFCQVTA